ncbi:MAG: glycoside hydrolase family 71/99-like protein [Halanaerobiales bacterium]|nr:glycoside hydrolase family 71/99-like protein [Halanaerobiales bacterium]
METGYYQGPSLAGTDTATLHNKIVCGYQGWFACEGDGAGLGWNHYQSNGKFEPGHCSIDLWPDVSELDQDEKYKTQFKHADGSTAYTFSSQNKKTVFRHFAWMRDYGIDAAFLQRFVVSTLEPKQLKGVNQVLVNCREAANRTGRAYIVMYDLSGLKPNQFELLLADWKRLVDQMGITRDQNDQAYLHHNGRPLIALWGMGFLDRQTTLSEWEQLVDFFKNDPEYGRCTVMLGVPTAWLSLDQDCLTDQKLHQIIKKADIVSPWSVGRYGTLEHVTLHAQKRWQLDVRWCQEQGKDYLPVVFPGFSWYNLCQGKDIINKIPRQKGHFLWKQCVEAKRAGASMLYLAMFDEIDEGTAIFKCTNNPPIGASKFVSYEGLPTDHYLRLAGKAGQMIRGEIPVQEEIFDWND